MTEKVIRKKSSSCKCNHKIKLWTWSCL